MNKWKKLRLKKGLTQQELSNKLKISIKTVSDIENNKRVPKDLILYKLNRYFNEKNKE